MKFLKKVIKQIKRSGLVAVDFGINFRSHRTCPTKRLCGYQVTQTHKAFARICEKRHIEKFHREINLNELKKASTRKALTPC